MNKKQRIFLILVAVILNVTSYQLYNWDDTKLITGLVMLITFVFDVAFSVESIDSFWNFLGRKNE